jgi:MFS family permease
MTGSADATEVGKAGPWTTFREMHATARLLLLGVFVNQFGAFLHAFLVLYLVQRGYSESQALFGMGAYGAGAVVGLLFGGGMSDRLGPRGTILVSMAASTVMPIAVTLVPNYAAVLVLVVVAGAMAQLYRPAAGALLAKLVPPARHTMAFSMNRIALNLGTGLGPLVAGLLIAADRWNEILWIDGLTAFLYLIIAALFLPKAGGAHDEDGSAEGPPAVRYLDVLNNRRYVIFLIAVLINAFVYIQTFSVLPLTIKDRGYPDYVFGWILTTGAATLICLELLVTRYTQHWQPRIAAALGLVLLGAGMTAFALPYGLAIILIGDAVMVIGQIIGGPAIFAFPARAAVAGATGRYLGAFFAMFGLGQAIGPMIAVPVYRALSFNVWYVFGAAALVSAAAAYAGMGDPATAADEGDPDIGVTAGTDPIDVEAVETVDHKPAR